MEVLVNVSKLTAWAIAFILDSWTDVLVEMSEVFETEYASTWGVLQPPTFGYIYMFKISLNEFIINAYILDS